jgi:hypothetical protein
VTHFIFERGRLSNPKTKAPDQLLNGGFSIKIFGHVWIKRSRQINLRGNQRRRDFLLISQGYQQGLRNTDDVLLIVFGCVHDSSWV